MTSERISGDHGEQRSQLEINDAKPIRALGHPARITALQHLFNSGAATATELGEIVGLSASAMSYHLRQLESAGLIEQAPSRGDGRERVWQSPYSGLNLNTDAESDPEARQASVQFLEAFLLAQEMRARRFLTVAQHDAALLDQGNFFESRLMLTAAEAAELGQKMQDLISPYRLKERPDAPADATAHSFIFRTFPLV
jgi:DNA-binding transcriptional ArsR family regulator